MNNKQKLIKAIDKDLNKNNTLNIINKKIDKSYKFNNMLKYAFVSSFIIIFILFISFNKEGKNLNQNKIFSSDNNVNTSQNIIINDVNIPIIKNDPWKDSISPIKGVKYNQVESIDDYEFYKDLNIDNEYNSFIMYEVYVNEENTKLNNYIISYKSENEDKDIEIAFSKENEPISNYEYKNINIKLSKINNVDVKIYKSDKIFISVFKYDNINFNITTYNLSKKELIDLLKSIIK